MDDLFANADEHFPPNAASFPDSTDFLFANPTSLVHTPQLLPPQVPNSNNNNNILPPQKLRPIRGSNYRTDEADGFARNVEGSGNVGSGFFSSELCTVNAVSTDYFITPEKQKEAGGQDTLQVEVERDSNGGGVDADGCYRVPGPVENGLGQGGDTWDPNGQGSSFKYHVSFSSGSDYDSSVHTKEHVSTKRRKKSRKCIENFMENLTMKVMERQEEMHKQLIELIEKKERDRIMREEAWQQQEIERIRRDEHARAQETSRNLALIAFIQNLLGTDIQIPRPVVNQCNEVNRAEMEIHSDFRSDAVNNGCQAEAEYGVEIENQKSDTINNRWPDAEVQALITLRTTLEHKFHLMGSKGSIWDEISAAMLNMGYHRNSKKCKEKWENINKYYKKTIGSGKKRRANSKACPYFDELDILYKNGLLSPGNMFSNVNNVVKTENDSIQ